MDRRLPLALSFSGNLVAWRFGTFATKSAQSGHPVIERNNHIRMRRKRSSTTSLRKRRRRDDRGVDYEGDALEVEGPRGQETMRCRTSGVVADSSELAFHKPKFSVDFQRR